ncbi:MAG: NnrU family protein [Burkholderiales bacterium]
MIFLVLGLMLFLGAHSVRIFADEWRAAQLERLGEMRWKMFYTLVSVAGFGLIIWGFGLARSAPVVLWVPPVWTRHFAAAMMLLSFILLVAAYVPGNHFKAKIGHPMVAGVKVWALAHLAANGTLADVVLFGAFLIWSIACFATARRRDRAAGVSYPASGIGRDLLVVGIGVPAWALFAAFGHQWLIGVKPFA